MADFSTQSEQKKREPLVATLPIIRVHLLTLLLHCGVGGVTLYIKVLMKFKPANRCQLMDIQANLLEAIALNLLSLNSHR